MMVMFILSVLVEVVISSRFARPFRKSLAVLGSVIIGLWSGSLIFEGQQLWAAGLLIINLFRVINLARIVKGRMHEQYLYRTTRRTSLVLIGFALLILTMARLTSGVNYSDMWLAVTVFQLIAAFIIVATITRNLYKTQYHPARQFYGDKELPTVTVAIPARNETAELTSCLTSILASDYPKLEVLVLDDCSQDRTSEIIKAFAQDGVRFVKGTAPHKHWLAKNQAYAQLAEAASGDYIIFCGVDVRFGPATVRSLVTTLLNKKRRMLSVMPMRFGGGIQTSFIQPLRYWWELALPRRLFNRPPVLSTCWLIERKALVSLGGFEAVSHSIIPEGYFARELVKEDGYTFIRADEDIDVRTVKRPPQQLELALRMRYPQLRRRPENVLMLLWLETTLLLGPFMTITAGFWVGFGLLQYLAGISSFLLILNHVVIVASSNPANSVTALFNFPFVVLTELTITAVSIYKYEFGIVFWKDRNICIPVMHTIPRLPPMKK